MILYCNMYLTAHYLYPLGALPYCNNEPPPSLMTVKPSTSLQFAIYIFINNYDIDMEATGFMPTTELCR